MATEATIITKGKSDYFLFKGVYANPYPSGTAEFNHYERGWMQSLKLNEGKLIGETARGSEPKRVEPAPVNEYAQMKGRSTPLKNR